MEKPLKHCIAPDSRLLSIEKLSPNAEQPRKTFDDVGIRELAESIRQHGIIEPLIVREKNDAFQIICGHRRYNAALSIDLKEIPVIVRNVSDEEALELQLIENLQREDVHPLQQAIGFKLLADKRQMDVQEIASRVGKSVYFIRQQLKLNHLIPKWQAMFSKDAISLTQALDICVLPNEAQKHLYESEVMKEDEQSEHPQLSINNYVFNSYRGILEDAPFDVKDPSLDGKAGPCSTCQFNSSFASLFPGEHLQSRCNNITCFKNKEVLHVHREIHASAANPTVSLVYESPTVSEKVAKILNEEGIVAHKLGYGEAYHEVHQPQVPIWDKFQAQQLTEGISRRQIKEQFKKAGKNYAKAIAVFDKNVALGKYRRALIVDSNYPGRKGKYVYVEEFVKTSINSKKRILSERDSTVDDINKEIERITQREVRAKELDKEKVHRKIVEAVKADKALNVIPAKSNMSDTALINFLLLQHLSFNNRSEVQKVIKSPALWQSTDFKKFHQALQSLSKTQITYLVRKIMLEKYSNSLPSHEGGYMVRVMAESLGSIPIVDFENEQKEIAKTRMQKVNERLLILQSMKSKLKPIKGSKNKMEHRKRA